MAYQSPIDLIMSEWQTTFEDNAVKAVQHYGFNVNVDELKMALLYDRGQYDKGYSDGRFDAMKGIVRCGDCKYYCKSLIDEVTNLPMCGAWSAPQKQDGFCNYGERMDEVEE